jgi:hypothetical protein
MRRRSAGVHVGDIKQVSVGAAQETDLERFAYRGVCAVTASQIGSPTRFLLSVGPLKMREHMIARLLEVQHRANTKPVGPAPTIKTSVSKSMMHPSLQIAVNL